MQDFLKKNLYFYVLHLSFICEWQAGNKKMDLKETPPENSWRGRAAMGHPMDNRGGYHELILRNGNVEINMQDRRRTRGAANQNDHTYHISIVGQDNSQETLGVNNIEQVQLDALAIRIAQAFLSFGWTKSDVDRIVRQRFTWTE